MQTTIQKVDHSVCFANLKPVFVTPDVVLLKEGLLLNKAAVLDIQILQEHL